MNSHGWIVYNGNLPGNKFLDFANMFAEAAKRVNSTTEIIKNNALLSSLTSEQVNIIPNRPLPDYVVFTDKDIYLAKQLEHLGIPVFNQANAIATSGDKIATYQLLAHHQLPIPKTIIAPKIFTTGHLENDVITQAVESLTFPFIVKEAFGSFGEQVYYIDSYDTLYKKLAEIGNKPFVFQEFIATSTGVDIRLQVVGDKVIAAMKRTSKNDFRANITSGGTMDAYKPTEQEKSLAIAATKAIGADYAGVDLLFGSESPLICEVNSNAHIRNLLDCTGVDAAEFIMTYIMNQLAKQGGTP